MVSQADKGARFRALHERDGAFIIPNPWDAGSARMLEGLGFEALATTSSGFAGALGRFDGQVTRDEKMQHCREICAAVDIPVGADTENCPNSASSIEPMTPRMTPMVPAPRPGPI